MTGKGGHAAKPQETVDPTVMAAHLVTALQTIASRNADPVDQVVVSVTSFQTVVERVQRDPGLGAPQGHGAHHEHGDARPRRDAHPRAVRACRGGFGGSAEVDYHRGYPVMVNHEAQTGFAA